MGRDRLTQSREGQERGGIEGKGMVEKREGEGGRVLSGRGRHRLTQSTERQEGGGIEGKGTVEEGQGGGEGGGGETERDWGAVGVIERGNNDEEKEEETKKYQRQHQLYKLLRTEGKGRGGGRSGDRETDRQTEKEIRGQTDIKRQKERRERQDKFFISERHE